ncbi:MAG: GldG family protein [Clostridia bacterium]
MKKESVFTKLLANRRLRYGSSAIVIMASIVVLFIVLNLIGGLVPLQLDLTPEGLYSIGEQTEEILEALDKDVTIYGLFDPTKVDSSSEYIGLMDLLEKYDKYDRVKVEYVDPSKNLGFISNLDPDQILNIGLKDFVVVSGNTKKVIKYYDMFVSMASEYSSFSSFDVGSKAEMAFTSAVFYATRDEVPKIYLTTGHGEYDFDDRGYITVGEVISVNGFDYEKIDLELQPSIPDDASIILIANPTSDFSAEEISLLSGFMEKGNSIMVALDSNDSPEKYKNLQGFLAGYNLEYGIDKIRETNDNYHISGNQYMIFPGLYSKTLLNNNIKDVFTKMLADNVRSVTVLRKTNSFLEINPLLISSDTAVSESSVSADLNQIGARFLGVAVEDLRFGSRIIALGTADFVQDQRLIYYKQYEESAIRFMLNSLKWLEGDTDDIFIETKDYFINLVDVTARQANTVSILVIYVMPGVILLAGLAVYLRRRNL